MNRLRRKHRISFCLPRLDSAQSTHEARVRKSFLINLIFFDFTHEYFRMNICRQLLVNNVFSALALLTFEDVNHHRGGLGVGWNARIIPRMILRGVKYCKLWIMEVCKNENWISDRVKVRWKCHYGSRLSGLRLPASDETFMPLSRS